MPSATGTIGLVVLGCSLLVFVIQELTQGFDPSEDGAGATRDDRWALLYLEVLPVAVVAVAIAFRVQGVGVLPGGAWIFGFGIIVMWTGVGIRQWSHVALGRFHQGVVTVHDDHEIVEVGPYRWIRHPMYAGSILAFIGIGFALGTWPGLVLCVGGTLPGILRRITVEERALCGSLGDRYIVFTRDRARLVPGIW